MPNRASPSVTPIAAKSGQRDQPTLFASLPPTRRRSREPTQRDRRTNIPSRRLLSPARPAVGKDPPPQAIPGVRRAGARPLSQSTRRRQQPPSAPPRDPSVSADRLIGATGQSKRPTSGKRPAECKFGARTGHVSRTHPSLELHWGRLSPAQDARRPQPSAGFLRQKTWSEGPLDIAVWPPGHWNDVNRTNRMTFHS
jgi:hypothetical protein